MMKSPTLTYVDEISRYLISRPSLANMASRKEGEKKKKEEKELKGKKNVRVSLCSLFYFPGEITICFQIAP